MNIDTDWIDADYEERTLLEDEQLPDDELEDDDLTDEDEDDDEGTDDDEVLSVEEAKDYIADTIAEFGRPAWIAHIPHSIRIKVPMTEIARMLADAKPSEGWGGQRDGRDTIIAWAKENTYSLITVKELAEIGEVSEVTVRNIIASRPDLFRKSDGRKYEVRDPEADRKADKK